MTAERAARAVTTLLAADAPPGLRERLTQLEPDHTLVYDGERLTVAKLGPRAPRLIADRRLVARPDADLDALAQALGDVRGQLILIGGYGDGSLAAAARRAGAVTFVVEVDGARLGGAEDLVRVHSLEDAVRETAAGRSVGWLGNVVALGEAMARRGFTPDALIDGTEAARVPEGYAVYAARILGERNPLELNRVRLESRERLNRAWRTLTERGTRALAPPRLNRIGRLALADGGFALRFERAVPSPLGAACDVARGAVYVDLAGSSVVLAADEADAGFRIKDWTSDNS